MEGGTFNLQPSTFNLQPTHRGGEPRLPCGGNPVHHRIQGLVDLSALRGGVEPRDRPADANGEWYCRLEIRDEGLDLAVVEDYAVGLVPQQCATQRRIHGGEIIRRDVDEPRLDSRGLGDGRVDLVPRQRLVGRDVEGLSDRLGVINEGMDENLKKNCSIKCGNLY